MKVLFFDTWESSFRIFIITILAYIALIVMLRVSGKRTLSKMNAFDFVVTIALGSTLATVILSKSVALLDGVLAFFLLIFLQYCITWLSVRYKSVKTLITSDPILLLYKGKMLSDVMKKERITVEEVHVAARRKGVSNLDEVYAIILETTGSMNVIPNGSDQDMEAMQDVSNYQKQREKHS